MYIYMTCTPIPRDPRPPPPHPYTPTEGSNGQPVQFTIAPLVPNTTSCGPPVEVFSYLTFNALTSDMVEQMMVCILHCPPSSPLSVLDCERPVARGVVHVYVAYIPSIRCGWVGGGVLGGEGGGGLGGSEATGTTGLRVRACTGPVPVAHSDSGVFAEPSAATFVRAHLHVCECVRCPCRCCPLPAPRPAPSWTTSPSTCGWGWAWRWGGHRAAADPKAAHGGAATTV